MCFLLAFILFVFIEEPVRVAVGFWYGEKHWTGKKPVTPVKVTPFHLSETGPAFGESAKKA